jgi:hypothetical protein
MHELLTLKARLPELSWRLRDVKRVVRHLPVGLFACARIDAECPASACIEEIQGNLDALLNAEGSLAFFLVQRIHQKIEVLLRVSQLESVKPAQNQQARMSLNQLMTRQNWLKQLDADITALSTQQTALQQVLNQKLAVGLRDESVAVLQRELGVLTRQLTEMEEKRAEVGGTKWRNYRLNESPQL